VNISHAVHIAFTDLCWLIIAHFWSLYSFFAEACLLMVLQTVRLLCLMQISCYLLHIENENLCISLSFISANRCHVSLLTPNLLVHCLYIIEPAESWGYFTQNFVIFFYNSPIKLGRNIWIWILSTHFLLKTWVISCLKLEKKSQAVFLLDWHWIQSEMCFSYARTKYTCSWLLALLAILYWHTATFSSIL